MDKTIFTTVELDSDGKLSLLDWGWLAMNLLARWKPGQKLIVRIQTWTPRRSLAANNYYWGVIIKALCEYTGYTPEEMHEILKARFAAEVRFIINEKTGEIIETKVGLSTRTMSKPEFAQFVDQCENLCYELNIQLPLWEGDKHSYAEDTR